MIRLHRHLSALIGLESQLESEFEVLADRAGGYSDAVGLLRDASKLAAQHLQTLVDRRREISAEQSTEHLSFVGTAPNVDDYFESESMARAQSLLSAAISSYAMLRSIALRNRDSILIGERNTGDIAEVHTKSYVALAHRLDQMLHSVVLWEMNQSEEVCRCTCPSCAAGICMCAQAPRLTLSNIWSEQGPISVEESVFVHTPRPGSPAADCGLVHGDIVVAADSTVLESHFSLQKVIGGHASGETVVLRVARVSGEEEDVEMTCP